MIILPFEPSVAAYEFTITLVARVFLFDVHWNSREGAWYFHLYDELGVVIEYGTKVVLGAILLGTNVDSRKPEGILSVFDASGENVDAGFDDIGGDEGARIQVQFMPFDEIGVVPV
jgi:hypothetical protein